MVKQALVYITLFAASSPAIADDDALGQWTLVWSDEFDGDALDESVWEPMIGDGADYGLPPGWGNNELQYYTDLPTNLTVEDGELLITARKQPYNGAGYTSARLRTEGAFEALYGRIEARITLPSGAGIWPAFWLLPTDSPYGGWAAGGEIDVVESVNIADTVYGTIHFGGSWPDNVGAGGQISFGADLSQAAFTYAVEWEPFEIRWYIGDILYHAASNDDWWSSNGGDNPLAPFDAPFHLLLNVAVGGSFPGPPNAGSPFPMTMKVDYVRVYERAQSPFTGEPHAVPGQIEAEDFDLGGAGWAYHDLDPWNAGGAHRPEEAVDVEPCAEGGFNVGWIQPGEWLEYTINVRRAGRHRLDARIAAAFQEGEFRLEIDGRELAGPIGAPVTGGWQNWTTVSTTVALPEGEHTIRFVNASDPGEGFNLNWLRFTRLDGPAPDPTRTGAPDYGAAP